MRKMLCCAMVGGLLSLFACWGERTEGADGRIDTLSLIMQLKDCSRLYTAEYEIHKLVLKDDPLKVRGNVLDRDFELKVPVGERKVMIPLDVTLKAYIDFSSFSTTDVERDGDRITVYLPDPRVTVTASRIDHDNVRQFVSLTRRKYSSAELADFARQGEEDILKSVPELGVLETARENAAHIIVPLLTRLGFEERNIVVTFRKGTAGYDLPLIWEEGGKTDKM